MSGEPKEHGLRAAHGCLNALIIMLPVWFVLGAIAAWLWK